LTSREATIRRANLEMAEREGFEPSVEVSPYTRLAGGCSYEEPT
jgi:uncharacterized protein (DUF2344 family)